MAQAAPIIAAVVGAAGTYMSYKSQSEAAAAQKDAAREAQRTAEMNAMRQERETAQQAENLRAAQKKAEAASRARAAASGTAAGGSQELVMEEQQRTHAEELAWLKQSGRSQADIIRRGGQQAYATGMAQASGTKAGAYGSVIGGAQQVYGIGKGASWWG